MQGSIPEWAVQRPSGPVPADKAMSEKAACGGPGTCLTAHDQNTGIDRKKTGEKAVPAFDLGAQLPGNFKQWFPQEDPAPTGADKITPAVITFLPQKQTDYGRQEQKQQQCGITADAFPQCLEQRTKCKNFAERSTGLLLPAKHPQDFGRDKAARALLPAAVCANRHSLPQKLSGRTGRGLFPPAEKPTTSSSSSCNAPNRLQDLFQQGPRRCQHETPTCQPNTPP